MPGRLTGKRAVITGAGSGIGRAAALKLAQEGAAVGVLDINLEPARSVAQLITAAGGNAIAVQTDVRDESAVAEAIEGVEQRFGGLDTLVANAGVMLFGRDTVATELDLETWRECLDVNLTGMFLTCKHGLRALQRNGSGAVVITGSPTGTHGCAPTFTAYSSSKAGTLGLMRILATDFIKHHIRVNAVMPGTIQSPLVSTLMEDPATRAAFLARIPLGRPGEVEEIANVIAFLASDEASYVSGALWYADGGLTAI